MLAPAMDVPRVPPVSPTARSSPATGERPGAGADESAFAPGQRLFARVIQAQADGKAVVELAGERVLASTPFPVRAGDELAVVVRGVTPMLELDIDAPPVAFSERAYAVAAMRQALQQATPAKPLTPADWRSWCARWSAATGAAARRAASGRASPLELLRPMPLARDAAPLVEQLRDRIASGGVFFEAHAARAAGAPRDPRRAPGRSALAPGLARSEAAAQPEVAALRQRLVDEVGARQLETVLARVRDGEVRVDVPLAFGHAAGGRAAGGPRRRAAAGARRPAARARDLAGRDPSRPGAGARRRALAAWPADRRAADPLRGARRGRGRGAGAGDGRPPSRLQAAGFRHVGVAVVVDPDAAAPSPDRPPDDPPPPGGSILSALA